jgi:hypothetical protein
MNALGIHTGLDMRSQTLGFMQANSGKSGAYYYWVSRRVDKRNSCTTKGDEMLRKLASSGETVANIAKILDRKPDSIRARATTLKIRGRKHATEALGSRWPDQHHLRSAERTAFGRSFVYGSRQAAFSTRLRWNAKFLLEPEMRKPR